MSARRSRFAQMLVSFASSACLAVSAVGSAAAAPATPLPPQPSGTGAGGVVCLAMLVPATGAGQTPRICHIVPLPTAA